MAHGEHRYRVEVRWTGNRGSGTSGYSAYGRDHLIRAEGKADIAGSSDPAFRGDPTRWNPEELLLASASACHKLWYLHLCSDAGIAVLEYVDKPEGTMVEGPDAGRFTSVLLRPSVVIAPGSDPEEARRLHHLAHEKCYIANSLNFPIRCEPTIAIAEK